MLSIKRPNNERNNLRGEISMTILKMLLLIYSFLSVSNVYGEVLFTAETGFIVKNKVIVKSDKEETWKVFSQQVDQWWPSDHTWWGENSTLTIDTFAGGCFCEKYGSKSAEHMRVIFVEPNTLLRMSGGLGPLQGMGMFGALDWTFTNNSQGTEVTMTYKVNGINPDGFKKLAVIVDKVQYIQLSGLANLIENNN